MTPLPTSVDPGPTDPPPNAPLPAAVCGDMNGGGDQHVDFPTMMTTKVGEKDAAMSRQQALLELRYDLGEQTGALRMTRGKRVQQGVRVRLPSGATWQDLANLEPEQIRESGLIPAGFRALPHPKQPEGGMLFPQSSIDEILAQTGRNLARFDLDFDLPEHLLPEFPPAICSSSASSSLPPSTASFPTPRDRSRRSHFAA